MTQVRLTDLVDLDLMVAYFLISQMLFFGFTFFIGCLGLSEELGNIDSGTVRVGFCGYD